MTDVREIVTNTNFIQQVESLQQQYQRKLPPVQNWNPSLSGDMDMRVAKDGRWYHEGDEIKRQSLVNLFSTILKKESDEYFLVTPVEKWRIQVEDAPFLVVGYEYVAEQNNGPAHYRFLTSTDDQVIADKEHPLWVETSASGEPQPYLMIRHGMAGLIHRNVYYQLVEAALRGADDKEKASVGIHSCGEFFPLA